MALMRAEVLVVEPVATVVLVAEPAEQLGKRELDALGLALVPGRGAEEVAAHRRRHRLHLLDADDERAVVAPGLDLRRRGEERDRSRRAGRLVTPGRQAGERRIDVDEKGAEVPLHGVELGGEVADVADLDLFGLDAGRCQPAGDGLADHRRDVLALLRPVAGEVGLVAAEDVDRSHGCFLHHP